MRNVYRLIRQLGVTSKYKGYYYVAEAVRMFMEIQDHPIKITKDIYARQIILDLFINLGNFSKTVQVDLSKCRT